MTAGITDEHESDQVRQRRVNFDALKALGVDPYPRTFERTHAVQQLVDTYSARTGEELTARCPGYAVPDVGARVGVTVRGEGVVR